MKLDYADAREQAGLGSRHRWRHMLNLEFPEHRGVDQAFVVRGAR